MSEKRLREAILTLARERAPAKTICPSDAARAVGGDDERVADRRPQLAEVHTPMTHQRPGPRGTGPLAGVVEAAQ